MSESQEQVFDHQMQRLKFVWPVDSDRFSGLCSEFRQLFALVGSNAFKQAVTATIENHHYPTFPTYAQLKTYLPASPSRDAQTVRHHECPLCHDSWVYTDEPGSLGNRQVKRCPNWRSNS